VKLTLQVASANSVRGIGRKAMADRRSTSDTTKTLRWPSSEVTVTCTGRRWR
jgi:hypothetical protein